MTPLFDRIGVCTAFFVEAEGRLLQSWGADTAFLYYRTGLVFNMGGGHVGFWRGDHLRGLDGGVIVWASGAHVGFVLPDPFPVLTTPQVPPAPGHGFIADPKPKPLDLLDFSSQMFGAW